MDLIAAHADWSADPRKRWATLARRQGAAWHLSAPRPVGDPFLLAAGLMSHGAPAVLGLDLPLGLPRAYAAGLPEADFPAFLRGLTARPGFWSVAATLEAVSRDSPFYPARGVRGMTRASHAAALGLGGPDGLSRLCDRATAERPAGAPLFWTLGANQTGKAAIGAWRDWLAPALAGGAPYALWPFEGGVHALLAPGRLVLAEVYPAEAMRHVGVRLAGSKRSWPARRQAAPALHEALARASAVPDAGLAEAIEAGFGADAAGEDRLDSLLGLLGLIGVLDGLRPDFVPEDPWVRRWEGWVMGQTALPRPLPGAQAAGR
ncbi:hypothetical protein LPC08_08400 [Roseomonas sp. OT10]|uniref:hypothetical protein n=1 Tax=Roseomonas cutis TaxID=2897332 RepID=UPI001E4931E9|nr:hypothetical protein [Roseomonas sp. OT10]UFN50621.1 hypothetical protein LPC08_08400 [Roseomonas sp. OT10]